MHEIRNTSEDQNVCVYESHRLKIFLFVVAFLILKLCPANNLLGVLC